MELHPAAMDDACLEVLKSLGVTMLSIGVESLSDDLLKLIGRTHDASAAEDAVRRAVAPEFDSVNVDLMFALPTQKLEDLDRDLQRVLALSAGGPAVFLPMEVEGAFLVGGVSQAMDRHDVDYTQFDHAHGVHSTHWTGLLGRKTVASVKPLPDTKGGRGLTQRPEPPQLDDHVGGLKIFLPQVRFRQIRSLRGLPESLEHSPRSLLPRDPDPWCNVERNESRWRNHG